MEEVPSEKPIPRYLQPTLSLQTQSSAHSEIERVANSFRTGTFYSVKRLPSNIRPGAVAASKLVNIAESKTSFRDTPYRACVTEKYFTPLQYSRTEYNKIAEIERDEHQHQRITEQSFSRKPFAYASSQVRLKNEEIFGGIDYTFPILGGIYISIE
jgi:hypothetical protein